MTDENVNPQDEPLELIRTCGPTEAEMIGEILRNNGIASSLQGKESAEAIPTTGEMDEVRIWVSQEDAVRARELVEGFFTPVAKDELAENQDELGVDDPDKPSGFKI